MGCCHFQSTGRINSKSNAKRAALAETRSEGHSITDGCAETPARSEFLCGIRARRPQPVTSLFGQTLISRHALASGFVGMMPNGIARRLDQRTAEAAAESRRVMTPENHALSQFANSAC